MHTSAKVDHTGGQTVRLEHKWRCSRGVWVWVCVWGGVFGRHKKDHSNQGVYTFTL